jgi:uncharacterized surface protein with fasciclin (FAS1) repeats
LNDELSTFVALLEAAGLTEIFSCPGPFTCLAPTNDAFDALDPAVVDELLLRDLLLYHLIPDLILSEDFEDGSLATLLSGQTVGVEIDPIMFNGDVSIVEDDILACNGVIHALEAVLLPGK